MVIDMNVSRLQTIEQIREFLNGTIEVAFSKSGRRIQHDSATFKFTHEFWAQMVDQSRYVLAQRAGRVLLTSIAA
jgi:hypothetical protein